ncbi:glutamine--fructose-6-phosphate transaminase (isomerizing) [Candidatus Mycosynbacter amalyticus]|uniref:Glutamine--fructose-6-phosphate aminotransferase [isomerizing] n=1 Tax=Candidatus Mycosynbacter amalyticus TaxID=2665156 RepID=A0A857MRR6_9BACT|nr:glutamine--fructose-6-phosphate transaminase (isomerizing) [Candidatus Mycosynbacter amalyticus]QHN43310.1 glutamine--fructose-6-phosphate transaminase (isomerizing) [Candidatus Mycosynbacter amalyticus]
MCGIVGYIGNKSAQGVLVSGLKRLEYRGYDSAGIATLGPRGAATVLRTKGKVQELVDLVTTHEKSDMIGIGHTRWATHGAPSKRNAHPHVAGNIHLVHNGIIENYQDLKVMLARHDYDFRSDTDTEVLAALIDYVARDADSLIDAVRSACEMVVGAYGIAVLDTRSPDEIVVARKGSPLVLGVGNGEVFIASDASALLGYTKQVIYLQDEELAICRTSGVELSDMASSTLEPTVETLEMDLEAVQKKGYDHFLLKEIHDQPDTVEATLRGRINPTVHTARLGGINMTAEELRDVRHIMIVGCGTAYYAGMLAKYYIEQLLGDVMVSVEVASELRYRSFAVQEGTVALIVSQSGETADTLACLMELKRRGVRTLGVVNAVGSTIAREVDGGVYVHVGAEISVASTKAFTSQVVAMILFALTAADARGMSPERRSELIDELELLPSEIEKVLAAHEKEVKAVAKNYMQYDHALYVGRDTLMPVALEGALKLKEVSYIHAEGYPAGELKHGPISLIDDRFFEVFYLLDNWLYEKSQSNLIEMNARGAHAIVVTDTARKVEAETVLRVSTKLDLLRPLVFNIISQLLAYYLAVQRDTDVDQPRNLAKSVTVE